MDVFGIIYQILRVLGAFCLFLYGMKLMSESLQKLAGVRLRLIVKSMISSRLKAIFSGLFVTAIIQASSATTVMIVSFVNAGLLTLNESIGVMMGANIGTTIKLWFIVALGMKFNLSAILLPLIGLSLPLLFSKKSLLKSWGEFVLGFSLLFLGIDFLIAIIPEIQNNTDLFVFLNTLTSNSFLSVLLFVIFGIILTASIQSSSATITFTIIMSLNGLLSFEYAAAMILGENIGTTLTANIAAIVANKSAKKAALAHSLFNISGVIWMLIILFPFLEFIDKLMFKFWGISPSVNQKYIPVALCFFHSSFNIINTLLWIGFVPFMLKILHLLIPNNKKKEKYQLLNIDSGLLSTNEMSIELLQKELIELGELNVTIFEFIPLLMLEKVELKYAKLLQKINKSDTKWKKKSVKMTHFITSLSQSEVSEKTAHNLAGIYQFVDKLKTIKANCMHMAEMIDKKNQSNIWFTQTYREQLLANFILVNQSLKIMFQKKESKIEEISSHLQYLNVEKIKEYQINLNVEVEEDNNSNQMSAEAFIIYKELMAECLKIINSSNDINLLIIN